MTQALLVYGGDFFDPPTLRSQWDRETLLEQLWDIEQVKSLSQDAEKRFYH